MQADPLELAWEAALSLRDLLKFEFFFAEKSRFREQLEGELALIDPDWRARVACDPAAAEQLLAPGPLVAHGALRSFIDAQWIVASELAALDPRTAIDHERFLSHCQGIGRQHVLQGRVHGTESVSRELFASSLKLAANRDVLDPGREDVRRGRLAWLAELEQAIAGLRAIRELSERALAGVLKP